MPGVLFDLGGVGDLDLILSHSHEPLGARIEIGATSRPPAALCRSRCRVTVLPTGPVFIYL